MQTCCVVFAGHDDVKTANLLPNTIRSVHSSVSNCVNAASSVEGKVVVCLNEVPLITSSDESGASSRGSGASAQESSLPPPRTAAEREGRSAVGSLQRSAAERDPSYTSDPAERLHPRVEAVLTALFKAEIPCVVFDENVKPSTQVGVILIVYFVCCRPLQ